MHIITVYPNVPKDIACSRDDLLAVTFCISKHFSMGSFCEMLALKLVAWWISNLACLLLTITIITYYYLIYKHQAHNLLLDCARTTFFF